MQDALPTLEEVKEWFTPNNRSVGVATGKVSNLFLLDFDFAKHPESLAWYEANKHRFPRTWTERTKSGGLHLYFKWVDTLELKQTNTTGANGGSKFPKGVDTKGYGGYAKITPSEGYEWIVPPHITPLANPPQWLLDMIPAKGGSFRRSITTDTSKKPNWFAEALAGLKEGNRNATFTKVAGSLRARGYEIGDIFELLKGKAIEVDFPLGELEIIANSVGRYAPNEIGQHSVTVEPFVYSANRDEYFAELKKRSLYTEPEFPTGFPSIDRYTKGYPRKNLFVIGAPTNGGKTQLVLSSILKLLEKKKKVLYFSTEMPQSEIRDRINAIGAGIPIGELMSGYLSDESRDKLTTFLEEFDFSGLHISPEDQPTLESMTKVIERVQPDIFFLDHIHHVRLTQENRRLEIDSFIMGLKNLVLKYDMPGVITAQLRRKEALKEGEPVHYTMHDFKESGGIENEAGVCFLICPPAKWTEERIQRLTGYIPKNRHGRREVRFSLDFNTDTATFSEA